MEYDRLYEKNQKEPGTLQSRLLHVYESNFNSKIRNSAKSKCFEMKRFFTNLKQNFVSGKKMINSLNSEIKNSKLPFKLYPWFMTVQIKWRNQIFSQKIYHFNSDLQNKPGPSLKQVVFLRCNFWTKYWTVPILWWKPWCRGGGGYDYSMSLGSNRTICRNVNIVPTLNRHYSNKNFRIIHRQSPIFFILS